MRVRAVVLVISALVILGVLLADVRAPAQEAAPGSTGIQSSAVKQMGASTTIKKLKKLDPVDVLKAQVGELRKEVTAQRAEIDKLKSDLARTNVALDRGLRILYGLTK
jgi:hypothetical protein